MCGVSCMSLGVKSSQSIVPDCIPEALCMFCTRMVQSYCFIFSPDKSYLRVQLVHQTWNLLEPADCSYIERYGVF